MRNIAKAGSTVPVKIVINKFCGGAGTVTSLDLYLAVANGAAASEVLDPDLNVVQDAGASNDNGLKFRVADGGYIYNFSTKGLSNNSAYTLRVRSVARPARSSRRQCFEPRSNETPPGAAHATPKPADWPASVCRCTGTVGGRAPAPFGPISPSTGLHGPGTILPGFIPPFSLEMARHRTMDKKVIRRAAALAVVAFLISATAVFADTVPADGDFTLPGNQATIDLGVMGPGQTVTRSVNFSLVCGGTSHPAVNSTLTIQAQTYSKPLDGTILSTSTTIGPVPASWPTNPNGCPSPGQPTLAGNGPVTITLKTPTTAGVDYQYTVIYARLGASGLTGTTAINFMVDVVVNAPPSLSLPGPMTVEATSAAGATVLYAVGASDVEDNPDPTPTCTPASGATFSLGQTTVACSVTDSAGLTTTGSFVVTVKDSAGPSLTLPDDITAEATSASGAAVSWTASATDLVDPSPSFGCSPVSGSTFALGTTTVSCAGTDFTGNTTTDTFDVTVVDTTAPGLTVPGRHRGRGDERVRRRRHVQRRRHRRR